MRKQSWLLLIALSVAGCEDSAGPVESYTITVPIASNQVREIPAGSYVEYAFNLPPRSCTITGRIEGVSGGNRDFEAAFLDDDNYRNWLAGATAEGYPSGRKVVWSFSVPAGGPGKWHLIVSNEFSALTAKVVTVTASAACPG
jgi:hypothetical protein